MAYPETKTIAFDAMRLRLASPETILSWSHGEVTKPETINYRTQKPEKSGLFAEEIFGPTKDWECYCGKYKKIRYKGIVCDKCGVQVTHSLVRREWMGHVTLASPVAHIWFLRSIPSKIGLVLDLSVQNLEKVIYFAGFIITEVYEDRKVDTIQQLRNEFKGKKKQLENEYARKISEAFAKDAEGSVGRRFENEREQKLKALEQEFTEVEREIKEIRPLKILSENAYHELSLRYGHLFEAGIGAEAILRLLKRMSLEKTIDELGKRVEESNGAKRQKLVRRVKVLRSILSNAIRPEWMILTVVPVVPPDLRPMVALDGGRFATSDLNDLYRRVINRNNRLKRLIELNAPEVIARNEKRMLQEAVDALIDNNARRSKTVTASTGQRRQLRSLADILKGKQGRFRQNLLGKRTDYSGRSVIVVGPTLALDECGLPKRMALELFKPFVMSQVIKREYAHNIRSASRFIESEREEVWDILEEITKGTHVLLNRAPTLHRLGIQAFRPRLIEGKAIQLHPLVCPAFNADFDGDQMAVHVPLTEEAKREAREIMSSNKNLLKPATGQPIVTPKQDIAWGCYYLTIMEESELREDGRPKRYFYSPEEAELAYKMRAITLHQPIGVRFTDVSKFPEGQGPRVTTTVGRILFNRIFPDTLPYYNEVVNVKKLGEIIRLCIENLGNEETARILDAIKMLGFRYITKSGFSLGMGDFPPLTEKEELLARGVTQVAEVETQYAEGLLTQGERHSKIIEIWTDIKEQIVQMSRNILEKKSSVYSMIDSGARGTWDQLTQIVGMKGLVSSPSGDIIELPVKGSFKQGFDVLEFFISTHGSRKGLSDTALRTANAGYLTRRLVDVAQDMVIEMEDCGDTEGLLITQTESELMGEKLLDRLLGRFAAAGIRDAKTNKVVIRKNELITQEKIRNKEGWVIEEARVRSPLTCKCTKAICQKCYGYDLAHNRLVELGVPVGIIAAQSIGEPGTQLTMRTFHTGGVAGKDITKGLPRVEELFEARIPKMKAFLSEVGGKVEIVSAEGRVIEMAGGKRVFEGRRGQKIVRIHTAGLTEKKWNIGSAEEVKVSDGDQIAEGVVLFTDESGVPVMAPHSGVISRKENKLFLTFEAEGVKEYIIPLGVRLKVQDGDLVGSGDQLTEGSIDLQELFHLKGHDAVARYILFEIQDIYSSQGQRLNDKHVELIIRQMFSRVQVVDPGDTDLLPGDVVEKSEYHTANAKLGSGAKSAEVEELFLGITKVSLSTQSFLSSASFQETARVLINAAVTGKVDPLEGLKENVIIGRLVPAGTGFKRG